MTAVIIIARGGSTRLPRKNIRKFCDVPLVAWSIIQARCSELVDRIFVSTDDDEIEMISKAYGAEVIRRPDWPDANQASGNRPTLHAIGWIKENYSDFDLLVTMLPTCPLRKPNDIDDAVRLYYKTGADYIAPMIPKRETCIYKIIGKYRNRLAIFDKGYNYGEITGGFAVCSPNWYVATNEMLAEKVGEGLHDSELNDPRNWVQTEGFFIPAEYWQYADTDTLEEFEFGELLMRHYILGDDTPKEEIARVYEDYRDIWETKRKEEIMKAKEATFDEFLKKKFGNSGQFQL